MAIPSISATQLLTPGRGGRKIAAEASGPHLGSTSAHFRYFHPLRSDVSSGRGPRAAMGGVMIRFATSECAPYSDCLLGNHLDYFHLISPRTLGRGHRGSPEGRCFLCSGGGGVHSFMRFVGVQDANGGGKKPSDFEGEKKRRLRLGGIIGLGHRKSSGQLGCFVTVDTISSINCPRIAPCVKMWLFYRRLERLNVNINTPVSRQQQQTPTATTSFYVNPECFVAPSSFAG